MGEQHAQSYVHNNRQLDELSELQWQHSFLCLLFIYLFSISRHRKLFILSNEINHFDRMGCEPVLNLVATPDEAVRTICTVG
jgi:hypothetical protein